mgnify:CR=1 FL=1
MNRFTVVTTFLMKEGNPKLIRDWTEILEPYLEKPDTRLSHFVISDDARVETPSVHGPDRHSPSLEFSAITEYSRGGTLQTAARYALKERRRA